MLRRFCPSSAGRNDGRTSFIGGAGAELACKTSAEDAGGKDRS